MRSTFRSTFASALPLVVASLLAAGCGGSGDSADSSLLKPSTGGSGGGAGKGGSTSKGGSSGASGASAGGATGGSTSKGGASGTGGVSGKGGASGKGGSAGTTGGSAGTKGGSAGASGGKGGSAGGTAGSAGSAGGKAGSSGAGGGAGGSGPCVPKTCTQLGADCGPATDGCGGVVQCGATCPAGELCGATTPNKCGTPMCAPKTCTSLGFECGPAGDGCGAPLDCGMCPAGQTCGGSGVSGKCGSTMMCVPKTCADQAISCGPAGDGCGGPLDCGSCPITQTCGGGGTPGACGAPACVAKTCTDLGFTCGPAGDGCGGLLDCGTCGLPQTCGGMSPGQCGTPTSCTNLCLQQVTCPGAGVTTTISGTVYAPNGNDPLPNAAVYVPNGAVLPFPAGVSCDTCGAAASGAPLVSAVTGIDGKFTLKNVPVGSNIPIVIQIGRWRRQIKVTTVTPCQDNPIPKANSRLPRNQSEGDIPLTAFATGSVDALECVMRKIGLDDKEFTKPAGNGNPNYVGRIHLYTGSGSSGADAGNGTPSQSTLVGSLPTLEKYDIVMFPCQGAQYNQTNGDRKNLVDYMNAGGRLFATHFSYVWLDDAPSAKPFGAETAVWNTPVNGAPNPADQTGYIDTTFPKGLALSQWLMLPAIGASTTLGQIPINTLRNNFSSVVAPSQLWMSVMDPGLGNVPMHYTFNTPVGTPPAMQCGRVVYDDFHVENTNSTTGTAFPNECAAGGMTAQEKLLEFMIFDLASCVAPDVPSCTPKTCTDQMIGCGPAGDGCGGPLDCGLCPAGQTCGGGGTPSQCGAPSCTPINCLAQGLSCGPAGDGCGNPLNCGSCPMGQTCGGGGKAGVCGNQMCTPKTCTDQGLNCGPAGDGCGLPLDCGACPSGKTCGGGGVPGNCGSPSCTPKTCLSQGLDCGPAGDGCGGLLQCGVCTAPQTCGGGGTPGVCGGNGKPLGDRLR